MRFYLERPQWSSLPALPEIGGQFALGPQVRENLARPFVVVARFARLVTLHTKFTDQIAYASATSALAPEFFGSLRGQLLTRLQSILSIDGVAASDLFVFISTVAIRVLCSPAGWLNARLSDLHAPILLATSSACWKHCIALPDRRARSMRPAHVVPCE